MEVYLNSIEMGDGVYGASSFWIYWRHSTWLLFRLLALRQYFLILENLLQQAFVLH
jgi:membrane peptidoglycan carboxypeptidase